ncbi:MAG: Ger(x)C family spore germination protein [Tumebacillaceae bacterium]
MNRRTRSMRLFLLLLSLTLLINGCARRFVLEDLGMVLANAYDLSEDGKILLTVTMPQASEEAKQKTLTITSKGDITKEARENISLATDRQVVSGQLHTVIFSEKLARQGIWFALDTLLRDVTIDKTLILCVSDGPAKDVLTTQAPDHPSSGRYIYELLRKEGKNFTIPTTTIHDFARQYYDDGVDPFIPYVRLTSGKQIQAAGTALFREDKFVGSLSTEETKLLLLLRGKGEGGDIKQRLRTTGKNQRPAQIMLTFVRTNNKRSIDVRDGKAHVRFDVQVYGQVIEYTGEQPLTDEHTKQEIERRIETGLNARMKDLVESLQKKYKCDPLGIGDHIKATGAIRPWTKQTWRKAYEEAQIEVNFNLHLIRFGLTK